MEHPEYEIDTPLSWLKKAKVNLKINDEQLKKVNSYLLSIELEEDIKITKKT